MNGKLRSMTALYLLKEDKILMLYRIGSRVADNMYVGVATEDGINFIEMKEF